MKTILLLNPKLLSIIVEKVHEENLPVEINEGENKDGLIVFYLYIQIAFILPLIH